MPSGYLALNAAWRSIRSFCCGEAETISAASGPASTAYAASPWSASQSALTNWRISAVPWSSPTKMYLAPENALLRTAEPAPEKPAVDLQVRATLDHSLLEGIILRLRRNACD
jgi:hypothetical protein